MKIVGYKDFVNEGFLNPNFKNNRADQVFKEMKEDYEASGQNVKKAKIYSDLRCMTYVFGDTPYAWGNREVGNKEVEINSLNHNGALMEITKWVVNPDHDPNYRGRPLRLDWEDDHPIPIFPEHNQEEKNKLRIYNVEEKRFYLSRNLARKIINFFKNEYDRKYPQLKTSEYRNHSQVEEIERGERPTLGYVHSRSMNGIECTFSIEDWNDVSKYKNWIKNSYAIDGRTKDNCRVTYCYKPEIDPAGKEVDPYGEEDWDTKEEQIRDWISNSTKEEVEAQIKKDINQGRSFFKEIKL